MFVNLCVIWVCKTKSERYLIFPCADAHVRGSHVVQNLSTVVYRVGERKAHVVRIEVAF